MHVGTGPDAHRPVGAGGFQYMHVGACSAANRSVWAGGVPYMRVGTLTCAWEQVWMPTGSVETRTCTWERPHAHWPEVTGGDLYMYVGAGSEAHRSERASWDP